VTGGGVAASGVGTDGTICICSQDAHLYALNPTQKYLKFL
jgi:hypothetical protein